jgi:hypothetical protein
MDDLARWDLMREANAAIGDHIDRAVEPIIAKSGLNGREWSLLLAALTFEPEFTTPAHLMVRGPYTAAEEYLLRMSTAAGLGFMEEVAPGEYHLTPAGRSAVKHFIDTARAAIAEVDPLPLTNARRLANLLDRLVQYSLETPPPPKNWSIRLSEKLMPDAEPPLPYIEQAISCLYAFRDDAHLAAWRNSELSATAFEALTLMWRKEARSLIQLADRLAYRGHPSHVYADALAELRERGLVTGAPEALRVTQAGQRLRDQIEEDTNRYFFAPWSCLDETEKREMIDLLSRLRDGLKR